MSFLLSAGISIQRYTTWKSKTPEFVNTGETPYSVVLWTIGL